MPHTLHRLTAYALIALGTMHTAFAVCYGELSPEAVWFAGTGLALVFLGLFNVAAGDAASASVWKLCRVANVVGVAFGAPAAIAVWEPQGYVGLLLLVALAFLSFAAKGSAPSGPPRLPRAATWGLVALFGLFTLATGYQLAGCIADGHPWFQIVTWALLLPAFGWAAWVNLRRPHNTGAGGGPAAG